MCICKPIRVNGCLTFFTVSFHQYGGIFIYFFKVRAHEAKVQINLGPVVNITALPDLIRISHGLSEFFN